MLKVCAGCLVHIAVLVEASNFLSLPEPHGHTAQVSPHLPNRDREWYTEYRWKHGQQYKPQDGAITTLPKHAPLPKHLRRESHDKWGEKSDEKAKQSSASGSSTSGCHGGTGGKDCKHGSKGDGSGSSAKNPSGSLDGKANSALGDTGVNQASHAVPKPCGHTSMVHPLNANRDREWYTEYRWKSGTQYKPQDGAITEKPKSAMKGITTSPDGDPCVPIRT